MLEYIQYPMRRGLGLLSCRLFHDVSNQSTASASTLVSCVGLHHTCVANKKNALKFDTESKKEGFLSWLCAGLAGLALWGGQASCRSALEDPNVAGGGDQRDKITHNGFTLLSKGWRQRKFFKYERRLRESSPPNKVFEYFANQRTSKGERIMTHIDVMRSLHAVYPPPASSWIRSGALDGEDSIKRSHDMSADDQLLSKVPLCDVPTLARVCKADGEVGISYPEWLFIEILLSYPAKDLWLLFRMIDIDGSGHISRDELATLLRTLLETSSERFDQATLGKTVADMESIIFDILRGKSRKPGVDIERFTLFCKALDRDIAYMCFAYYADENMELTGYNLALSLVASFVNLDRVDTYLDCIQDIPEDLQGVRIDFDQFQAIHNFIDSIDSVLVAFNFHLRMSHASSIDQVAFQNILLQIKGKAWYHANSCAVDILFFVCSKGGSEINIVDFRSMFSDYQAKIMHHPSLKDNEDLSSKLHCALQCFKKK